MSMPCSSLTLARPSCLLPASRRCQCPWRFRISLWRSPNVCPSYLPSHLLLLRAALSLSLSLSLTLTHPLLSSPLTGKFSRARSESKERGNQKRGRGSVPSQTFCVILILQRHAWSRRCSFICVSALYVMWKCEKKSWLEWPESRSLLNLGLWPCRSESLFLHIPISRPPRPRAPPPPPLSLRKKAPLDGRKGPRIRVSECPPLPAD